MVERVAHEVHERVADRVDDGAVELGVLADELELDLLAELAREVADEPREAQEDGLHGDHADLHDDRLQGVRAAREVLHGLREAGHLGLGGEDLDLGALDDQLAHEVHELVQALGVDADGRGDAAPPRRARRPRRARGTGAAGSATATTPASATSADLGGGDVGHGGQGGAQRGGLDPGCDPHVHAAAVEGLDVVLLRSGGDHGAEVGGGGDDHVGAHGRHQRFVARA